MLKYITLSLAFMMLYGCCSDCRQVWQLRNNNAQRDYCTVQCIREVPDYALTLDDIIEIALVQNYDILASRYQRELQASLTIAEQLKMIPPLTFDGLISGRSNRPSSTTRTLAEPSPSNNFFPTLSPPQVSSISATRQWSLRETLNIVDFGLAYVRSKQECYKTWVVDQQNLRARQKLAFDIVGAYWRAITAQKVLCEAEEMIDMIETMQKKLEGQLDAHHIPVIPALETQTQLLIAQAELTQLRYQWEIAKADLVEAMGLPVNSCIVLADVDLYFDDPPCCNVLALEELALVCRPELSVKDLEERIAIEGVREAVIQMLPNAAIYGDFNYDGNPYLIHANWWSIGAKVAWNLLQYPQRFAERRAAWEKKRQTYYLRLALSIAVMTQVNVSYLHYEESLEQYDLAKRSYELRLRIADAATLGNISGDNSGIEALGRTLEAMRSKIYTLKAYSDYRIAQEQLHFAVGIPLGGEIL